ncbi:hypothetical protein E5843_14450 [Luteimonas yindakuii]|uniref:hypothetical protein n=1 Tax=Luteimonas yindakuii TaxID=2565782 RepID=UPI0011078F1A|nr:hypothetical protein [Luteimonas yindakuii]QCU72526.1 hypothetical protein E5843_14450 [Luteimonas yindakuii]
MRPILLGAILLALPGIGGCTQPRGTYQAAAVSFDRAGVCFSIPDSEESRRSTPEVTSLTVSRLADDGWVPVLQWDSPGGGTRLRPGECLYRARVEIHPRDGLPDETLRPGARYGVDITGEIANPAGRGDPTVLRRYEADFCLVEHAASMRIELVPRTRGELDWSVCETPAESGHSAAKR